MDDVDRHILIARIALGLGLKKIAVRHMEQADDILVGRILRKQ
jgi:hypothetical protein